MAFRFFNSGQFAHGAYILESGTDDGCHMSEVKYVITSICISINMLIIILYRMYQNQSREPSKWKKEWLTFDDTTIMWCQRLPLWGRGDWHCYWCFWLPELLASTHLIPKKMIMCQLYKSQTTSSPSWYFIYMNNNRLVLHKETDIITTMGQGRPGR